MAELSIQEASIQAAQHLKAGRLREAETLYRQILSRYPGHAESLHYLGVIAQQVGRSDAAIDLIRRAIAIDPSDPLAHNNLGFALKAHGQPDAAIAAYRQSIALNPHYALAFHNLGVALADVGRLDEAIAVYRQALAIDPNSAPVQSNLGGVQTSKRQFNDAIASFRRAIAIDPNYVDAQYNLGVLLQDHGPLDEAIAAYQRAIAIDPKYVQAYNNLGSSLKKAGQVEASLDAFRKAAALPPGSAAFQSNVIYTLYFHEPADAGMIQQEQARWNRQFAEPLRPLIRAHTNDADPERRLRIGYVSADFCYQAEVFFVIPLLEAHDKRQVEIVCYSSVVRPDGATKRLRKSADAWHEVGALDDEKLAEKIRADRIDILVDLTMHMSYNRLPVFARKPAPVQVSWLAYPGDTGLATIDCHLTDPYLEPQTDSAAGNQRSVRLPDSWVCYDPLVPLEPRPPRSPGSPIVFGSLNNPCKINEPLLDMWARVLQRVPDSRFLLQAFSQRQREGIGAFFLSRGIDPARIEFEGRTKLTDYMRMYDRIDIALDPLPYNGITTSCDALWMGVPVVSRIGPMPQGRAGLSILSNLGLAELAAADADSFVRIAADLAGDSGRLDELHRTLRQRMKQSPLLDGAKFARNVESAYRDMWRNWCASKS